MCGLFTLSNVQNRLTDNNTINKSNNYTITVTKFIPINNTNDYTALYTRFNIMTTTQLRGRELERNLDTLLKQQIN